MTTNPVRISVVTVCFNAVASIAQTLESVEAQVGDGFEGEYIVIDGASTDGTRELLDLHAAAIDTLVSEPDGGIFDAMNKGAALATGDVVYFLNADDSFVDPNVLADVARVFVQDPARALVYGNVLLVDEPSGVRMFPARAFEKRSVTEFLHNSFCHQAVFARRTLFDQLGPFDLRYRYSADYEWIIRAFKLNEGRDFYFIDRPIAYYSCLGRSNKHVAVTRREVRHMQSRHFFSPAYVWYFFRYVLVRGFKKRLLNEVS